MVCCTNNHCCQSSRVTSCLQCFGFLWLTILDLRVISHKLLFSPVWLLFFSSFSIGKINKYLIDFFEDKKVRKIALENGITGKDFLLVLIIVTDNNNYKLWFEIFLLWLWNMGTCTLGRILFPCSGHFNQCFIFVGLPVFYSSLHELLLCHLNV